MYKLRSEKKNGENNTSIRANITNTQISLSNNGIKK